MRRLLLAVAFSLLPACGTLHELEGDHLDVPATGVVGAPVPVRLVMDIPDDWDRPYVQATREAGNVVRLTAYAWAPYRFASFFSGGPATTDTSLVFDAPGRYTVKARGSWSELAAAIDVAAP